MNLSHLLKERPFAYSEIFTHPPLSSAAFVDQGHVRQDLDPFVATVCKNESNCTLVLKDGTLFTTWSQGSFEHGSDERIVFSTSRDHGKTWEYPRTILLSSQLERIAYGIPFLVPGTGRIYLFFHASLRKTFHYQLNYDQWMDPFYDAGRLGFVYSDNLGGHWSPRYEIDMPNRDIDALPGVFHGWVNHPPILMPDGEVLFTVSSYDRRVFRRAFMLHSAEVSVVRCDNLLKEKDPRKLSFSVWPEGPRGIRVDAYEHKDNASLNRLVKTFGGFVEDSGWNFQEMTLAPLHGGRILGVGRCSLGSPGYTISSDGGKTWLSVQPLRNRPGGDPIRHPVTMCPIFRLRDGRFLLFTTDNDGFQRGASHIWEGKGMTRNPQFICVGIEKNPGSNDNAGLVFGKLKLLAEVAVSSDANLKTGVSMPHYFESSGRHFVGYNINKEHLLLDEMPADVLDELTPE